MLGEAVRNFVQVFFPPLGQQPLVFPARLTLNRWEILLCAAFLDSLMGLSGWRRWRLDLLFLSHDFFCFLPSRGCGRWFILTGERDEWLYIFSVATYYF